MGAFQLVFDSTAWLEKSDMAKNYGLGYNHQNQAGKTVYKSHIKDRIPMYIKWLGS